jgi:outer membrane murein-binding lipoprotein Lpp
MPNMPWLKKHAATARVVAVIALGGLALSACATTEYVDQQIAAVNSRIDQVDARVQAATQRADAAASSAQSANQAAQAAATDARTANQRIDQLTGRVDTLEKAQPAPRTTGRTPRG